MKPLKHECQPNSHGLCDVRHVDAASAGGTVGEPLHARAWCFSRPGSV